MYLACWSTLCLSDALCSLARRPALQTVLGVLSYPSLHESWNNCTILLWSFLVKNLLHYCSFCVLMLSFQMRSCYRKLSSAVTWILLSHCWDGKFVWPVHQLVRVISAVCMSYSLYMLWCLSCVTCWRCLSLNPLEVQQAYYAHCTHWWHDIQ